MPVEITPIGLAFLLAIGLCLIVQPRTLIWVLSAAIPFSHASMITFGENGLSPFWVAAIAACGRLGYLVLARGRRTVAFSALTPRLRGANMALLGFTAYAALITAVGPLLFRGVPVISSRGGLDSQIDNFTPLTYSISNFAQLGYLLVGVGLVLYLVAEPPTHLRSIEVAIVIGFALTLFKHFFPDFWPQAWFDSNPSYTYHWLSPTARERGPFAEPSLLGMFVSMSLAYSVASFIHASWRLRIYYGALAAVGLYLLSISYTGTALISLAVVGGAAIIALIVILARRATVRTRWIAVGVALACGLLAAIFHRTVKRLTVDLIIEKLGSDSFSNRSASNHNSFQVFLDSFGLGIGLGSDRPSSLFFLLISCVGVLGTLLFVRMLLGYAAIGFRRATSSALAWAFLAQIAAQFIAKPDLSMPAMWFLIATLAVGYNAWARRVRQSSPHLASPAVASLATWIPSEIQLRRLQLPGDTAIHEAHVVTRGRQRRLRLMRRAGRRGRLLGAAAITAVVFFFGAAGYDGYAAQHEASIAVEKARASVGTQVQKYTEVWSSVAARKVQAKEQEKVLLSVLKWTTPEDFAPSSALEEFRQATESFRWTAGTTPAALPLPSQMEELTSYTPPAAGMDTRSTDVAVAAFAQREHEVESALTNLRAYLALIETRYDQVLDSFAKLSDALIEGAGAIDVSTAPTDEATDFAVAMSDLSAVDSGTYIRTRYEKFMAVVSARNQLLTAIEAQRLAQEQLERAERERAERERIERERAEQERAQQQEQESQVPENQVPPSPSPQPTAPTPEPTMPTPQPTDSPAPDPEPTVPVHAPSEGEPGA